MTFTPIGSTRFVGSDHHHEPVAQRRVDGQGERVAGGVGRRQAPELVRDATVYGPPVQDEETLGGATVPELGWAALAGGAVKKTATVRMLSEISNFS